MECFSPDFAEVCFNSSTEMAQREKKDRFPALLTYIMRRSGQSRLTNNWSVGVKAFCIARKPPCGKWSVSQPLTSAFSSPEKKLLSENTWTPCQGILLAAGACSAPAGWMDRKQNAAEPMPQASPHPGRDGGRRVSTPAASLL